MKSRNETACGLSRGSSWAVGTWPGFLVAAILVGAASCQRTDAPESPISPVIEPTSHAAVSPPDAPPPAVAEAPTAKMLFETYCSACHGPQGRGDGPAAYLVYPKPRDFTSGVFRFKSTPEEQAPTPADLRRIIKGGVARTAMPPFEDTLSDAQIDAVGEYVVSIGPPRDAVATATPAVIPAAPALGEEQFIREGRLIYAHAGCAACHGETGRGDGPASATLADTLGYPLPPADFTTGVYKSGRSVEDLYRTILLGVPGTPMPSFGETLKEPPKIEGVNAKTNATWAIVAYLKSLESPREAEGIPAGAVIRTEDAADPAMLKDSSHAAWAEIKAATVSLQPLWQRRASARAIEVRAVRTGDRVAICLDWPDATVDAVADVSRFSDAGAAMFGLGEKPPPLTMGSGTRAGESEALVNIWQWKASRQLNADESRLHDAAGRDGNSPADLYMFKRGDPAKGPIAEHDKTFISAWDAGNPNADPALLNRSVLESNAAGFGSLTQQPASDQNVEGTARWRDGRWRVLMSRSLQPADKKDVSFASAARIPLAFAVWDGHAGDRNGTKLISGWHWLEVTPRSKPESSNDPSNRN